LEQKEDRRGAAVSGAKLRSEGSPRRGKPANGPSRGTVSSLIRQRKNPVTLPSARAMNRVLLSKRLSLNDLGSNLREIVPGLREADHYEPLSRGWTRQMTTDAEADSTGNREEPEAGAQVIYFQALRE
jgi:hypothetical protein